MERRHSWKDGTLLLEVNICGPPTREAARAYGEAEAMLYNLPMAGVAAAIYLLVGNRLFLRTANPVYHHGLTLFTLIYGITLLITS